MTLSSNFQLAVAFSIGILCGIYFGYDLNTYNDKFRTLYSKSPFLRNGDVEKVLIRNYSQSHDHIEKPQIKLVDDSHKHKDDGAVAKEISSKVKVLIWVMTTAKNHQKKASVVKETWGKHCEKLLFMSDTEDNTLPAIAICNQTGREHLTAKTMRAFDYLYKHHLNDYDWFMKADDDTYVVMENLRYMLSGEDPMKPIFFGHHFKTIVKQGYNSGGGGYVISKEALKRFGKRNESTCAKDGGPEDVKFGQCMEKLGVSTGDSRDSLNRTRFHCFDPKTHIVGGYPNWYYQYDKHGAEKGPEAISDYAISFHYVPPNDMMNMELFLYHLRPYGLSSGLQDLNKHKTESAAQS